MYIQQLSSIHCVYSLTLTKYTEYTLKSYIQNIQPERILSNENLCFSFTQMLNITGIRLLGPEHTSIDGQSIPALGEDSEPEIKPQGFRLPRSIAQDWRSWISQNRHFKLAQGYNSGGKCFPKTFPFQRLGSTCQAYKAALTFVPASQGAAPPRSQDSSHHQDCYICSRESQPKPIYLPLLSGAVDPMNMQNTSEEVVKKREIPSVCVVFTDSTLASDP